MAARRAVSDAFDAWRSAGGYWGNGAPPSEPELFAKLREA